MKAISESRITVRLNTEIGLASLHSEGFARHSCRVTDISFSECDIEILRDSSNDESFVRWTELLIPGRRLVFELFQPEISQVETSAIIYHTGAHTTDCVEIDFAFIDVPSTFDQAIRKTVEAWDQNHPLPHRSWRSPLPFSSIESKRWSDVPKCECTSASISHGAFEFEESQP